jgi:TM2 domain-containing membrane protein YozV
MSDFYNFSSWSLRRMILTKRKSRSIAAILAFSGTLTISGLHKFYLGQPLWGILYVLLSWTPIPKIASAIEGVWYLTQEEETFDRHFNLGEPPIKASSQIGNQVESLANALRELEALRQDGLISEYEFEQKRRQMLDSDLGNR